MADSRQLVLELSFLCFPPLSSPTLSLSLSHSYSHFLVCKWRDWKRGKEGEEEGNRMRENEGGEGREGKREKEQGQGKGNGVKVEGKRGSGEGKGERRTRENGQEEGTGVRGPHGAVNDSHISCVHS